MAPKSNNIVFKGKTYEIGRDKKYKSIVQVATALNVSTNDLKKYRESTNTKRIFVKEEINSMPLEECLICSVPSSFNFPSTLPQCEQFIACIQERIELKIYYVKGKPDKSAGVYPKNKLELP